MNTAEVIDISSRQFERRGEQTYVDGSFVVPCAPRDGGFDGFGVALDVDGCFLREKKDIATNRSMQRAVC